jgi:hypothetical protein
VRYFFSSSNIHGTTKKEGHWPSEADEKPNCDLPLPPSLQRSGDYASFIGLQAPAILALFFNLKIRLVYHRLVCQLKGSIENQNPPRARPADSAKFRR